MPPTVQSTPTGEAEYRGSMNDAAETGGSHEVRDVTVEPTENGGFSVNVSYRQKDSGKGGPTSYLDPKKYAFSTLPEVCDFLGQTFGQPAASDTTPPPAGQ